MTTNKKEFKEAVRAYIIDCIEFEDDETKNEEATDWKVAAIYHQFKREKLKGDLRYNRTDMLRPINEREIFKEWVSGLPTNINIEFRGYEQSELMAEWFKEAGMVYDADRFNSDIFYSLVAREFYRLVEKYDLI